MRQNAVKSVISGKVVTVGSTPVYVGGENCLPAPRVTLHRTGQHVSAIEVRCGCGEVIVLDCVYERAADPIRPDS